MEFGLKSPAILTLLSSLAQLLEVAHLLNDDQFAVAVISPFKSTIGAHFRHCLDHCNALLMSAATGVVDYEARVRSTDVETNRAFAIGSLARLQSRIVHSEFLDCEGSKALGVLAASLSEGSAIQIHQCWSTWERELFFVASHTVHHLALIKVQASLLGVELNQNVGLGLGTKKWIQEVTNCAP